MSKHFIALCGMFLSELPANTNEEQVYKKRSKARKLNVVIVNFNGEGNTGYEQKCIPI